MVFILLSEDVIKIYNHIIVWLEQLVYTAEIFGVIRIFTAVYSNYKAQLNLQEQKFLFNQKTKEIPYICFSW